METEREREKRKIDIEIPMVREKALRQQLLTKVKRCHQDSTKQESCHLKPDAYIHIFWNLNSKWKLLSLFLKIYSGTLKSKLKLLSYDYKYSGTLNSKWKLLPKLLENVSWKSKF